MTRKYKLDDFLEELRKSGRLVSVENITDCDSFFTKVYSRFSNIANISEHDFYVKKLLEKILNDGYQIREIGLFVECDFGEYDILTVDEEDRVSYFEVKKRKKKTHGRRQVERFRKRFEGNTKGFIYIGSTDEIIEVF